METKLKKRPGPKAAWREHLCVPGGEATVAVAAAPGRVRVMTAEQKARQKVYQAGYQARKREMKLAARAEGEVTRRRIDLTGRVIGKLTVRGWLDTVGPRGRRKARWTVDCACGREVVLRSDQLLAQYGRKHCGCDPKLNEVASVPAPGDVRKRGGAGKVPKVGRAKKVKVVRELSAAELAEEARQAAEKAERLRIRSENAERARRGEPMLRTPVKPMDADSWLRLLVNMRRAGARWSDMGLELESAAAFGVTREGVVAAMG